MYDGPKDEATTTTESDINLINLTTNCLWGPWSSWDQCSVSCGGGGVSKRTRTVAIPEKNGGECSGEAEETAECSTNTECGEDLN